MPAIEPVDVLWFVGDYVSFDPRSQKVTQALARLFKRSQRRLRNPLRRGAQRGQRRAARWRGGSVARLGGRQHRDTPRLRLQPHRHERSALAQHAAQRVPGARRKLAGDASHHVHPRAARGRPPSAGLAAVHRHLSRPLLPGPRQRRVRERRDGSSSGSVAGLWRCRATARTRSAAAPEAGGSGRATSPAPRGPRKPGSTRPSAWATSTTSSSRARRNPSRGRWVTLSPGAGSIPIPSGHPRRDRAAPPRPAFRGRSPA
jgi:hypothetical protein